jgi:hypothetical protein
MGKMHVGYKVMDEKPLASYWDAHPRGQMILLVLEVGAMSS